ncbi:MAG: chromosome segregation ATPase [Stenomitos rutilans HA7619-LM2]|nr:chromosome segregation ATPase [Stenomitos rutilans HA7619-LM2]
MTRDSGTPDRQPSRRSHEGRNDGTLPPQTTSHPVAAASVSQPRPQTSGLPRPQPSRPVPPPPRPSKQPKPRVVKQIGPEGPALSQPSSRVRVPRRWFRWLYSWKVWLLVTGVGCVGTGALALALLLQLPGLPNCPAIFWPLASASLRFECARLAASKQTSNDLLEAIALVDSLPKDHPLRDEADRLVELWSLEVLKLAEADFNAGKLNEAIAAARRISPKVSAYKLVEERVQRWQTIWSKAETLYRKAEQALRDLDWRQAFSYAVRLLDVDNDFWQTTKYNELTTKITASREDGNTLGKAQRLADDGGLTNLLEAIKLAQSIGEKSYVHQAAQKAIGEFGQKMVDLAQTLLDQRDLQGALNVLSKIPEVANLDEQVKDLTVLANAQSQVWLNTVPDIEEAISQAQRIQPNRPLYRKAQQLIVRWQLEIEAIAQLEKARILSQPGTVADLSAAIAEASTISRSNPRWGEVQKQIQTWTAQVQTIEDRPILDQAEQIATQGDVASLQAAAAQANQIAPGRALYKEAQGKARTWTGQVQQIQDQPYLDRAREFANAGDLSSAIRMAEQIGSGRSLYADAQVDVKQWRKQLRNQELQAQAEQNLQTARQLANSGSPEGLANAIRTADQVPAGSALRSDADNAINEWSSQLLQVAKSQSVYDVPGAIAVAQKIPSRAGVYAEAQQEIQAWKRAIRQ